MNKNINKHLSPFKPLHKGWLILILILGMSFSQRTNKPTRIIFFGDSITEMGAYEGGYITRLSNMLIGRGLEKDYELIGAGIGGNKIYDLYLRLEEDVLSKNPDVVVVYIGVNDVWHKVWGTGTDEDKFARFYAALIGKIKAQGAEVILCTPAVIGEKTDFSNQLDGDLNQYSGVIRNLAKEHNCRLCDLRKLFLEYNLSHNPENQSQGILTTDRVHLNDTGNQLVADALLKMFLPGE